MNPRQRFLDAAARLLAAAQQLGLQDPAPVFSQIWDYDAHVYIRWVAAHFVLSDDDFAPSEFGMLEAFNDDGMTYHEELELARSSAVGPDSLFLRRAPIFLTTASEIEPALAREMREAIREMVLALVNADGRTRRPEVAMAVAYLKCLRIEDGADSQQ